MSRLLLVLFAISDPHSLAKVPQQEVKQTHISNYLRQPEDRLTACSKLDVLISCLTQLSVPEQVGFLIYRPLWPA